MHRLAAHTLPIDLPSGYVHANMHDPEVPLVLMSTPSAMPLAMPPLKCQLQLDLSRKLRIYNKFSWALPTYVTNRLLYFP